MAVEVGGHVLVSVGNLLHVIYMFLNNYQHSMMPTSSSMVFYLWTLCFFPFIFMMHAFNCSVYFNIIILSCEVIPLVCLHLYVHR